MKFQKLFFRLECAFIILFLHLWLHHKGYFALHETNTSDRIFRVSVQILAKKKKKKIKQDKSPPSRKLGHIHFSAYFLSLSIPIFLSFTSSPHTSITLFLPFFLSFFFLFSLFIILRNSPSSIPSLYLFVFISLFSRFCVLFYFSPPIFFSVPSHFLYSVRQFLVDLC